MTETLRRPARARPGPDPWRPLLQAALPAAAWAAAAGLLVLTVPVLLVWATDPRSGSGTGSALRACAAVWLVAHGAGVHLAGGPVGLSPLGLVAVPLALLARVAAHAARRCGVVGARDATRLALVVATPYAVLAALVAGVSGAPGLAVPPAEALVAGMLVGLLGAGVGVGRVAGAWSPAWAALPGRLQGLAVATVAAVAVLTGAGALLAGGSLLVHAGAAADLARATGAGPVGGLALLLLGVALVPNGVVFGAAWLCGPGFAVGTGTAVGPFATSVGAVPALPLLAALPAGPVPVWTGVVALLVPLSAGALAGLLVARRLPESGLRVAAAEAALVGPCAGAAAGLLAVLAGGSLGLGRLAEIGPVPWRLALAVTLEVGAAAALTAPLVRRRSSRGLGGSAGGDRA